ncbi:hypothetical protein [Clostridioides difficile]|uniref:hypothetical protein n=1 Tax=Clostridioides difficile TaxID=1496 RepID=UPI00097FFEBD|nr:hypothetical protein [Clostridioides difficile]SJT05674.1 Uncharacterised protein [Clostridioides difficile]SJT09916.1 Uncharacterised protein [Clostridioides difficile]SJT56469.1 Uncharacterised protein [Clostridioides difficile]
MIIAISLTLGLITGCINKVSDTNEKIYTIEQISSIKEDLSKKISESIENSGLRVVENKSDGSFVLSLGNLEYTKEQPSQVLHYSMIKDKKGMKEILSIQCVKDFSYNEKLSEDDIFIMAIYNIYRSLIHVEISEKEFFRKIEEVFNKGEGNVEIDNLGDIKIQVKKFDDKTKSLELKLIKEFKLKYEDSL